MSSFLRIGVILGYIRATKKTDTPYGKDARVQNPCKQPILGTLMPNLAQSFGTQQANPLISFRANHLGQVILARNGNIEGHGGNPARHYIQVRLTFSQ